MTWSVRWDLQAYTWTRDLRQECVGSGLWSDISIAGMRVWQVWRISSQELRSKAWFLGRQASISPQFSSVQSLSRVQLLVTPWMPGLPVHHQLPEFTQTHVHWVGDAIQPSHPLWSPSLLTFNLSQHQGLFQWVSSLHQVAKVLEFQL